MQKKLQRALYRALSGIGLIAVFGACAGRQQPHSAPVPQAASTEGLVDLRAEFSKTQLGADLLGFASDSGVKVMHASNIGAQGKYYHHEKVVIINSSRVSEDNILTLAHELRHAWQDKMLNYSNLETFNLTPRQYWNLRQYMEADACAFSAYFSAERAAAPDIKRKGAVNENERARVDALARRLKDKEEGLAPEDYRRLAFEDCVGMMKKSGYPERHAAIAAERLDVVRKLLTEAEEHLAANDPEKARKILLALNARVPDTALAKYLRLYGGTTLDPDSATALQAGDVSDRDIMRRIPQSPEMDFGMLAFLNGLSERHEKILLKTRELLTKTEAQKPAGPVQ